MTVTWIYTESDVGPLLQALMDDDPYENTRLAIPEHARPEAGTLVTRTVVEEVSVPELIRAIHDWAPA